MQVQIDRLAETSLKLIYSSVRTHTHCQLRGVLIEGLSQTREALEWYAVAEGNEGLFQHGAINGRFIWATRPLVLLFPLLHPWHPGYPVSYKIPLRFEALFFPLNIHIYYLEHLFQRNLKIQPVRQRHCLTAKKEKEKKAICSDCPTQASSCPSPT